MLAVVPDVKREITTPTGVAAAPAMKPEEHARPP